MAWMFVRMDAFLPSSSAAAASADAAVSLAQKH